MNTPGGGGGQHSSRIDAEHTGEEFYIIYDRADFDAWIQSDYHVDRTNWR